MDLRRLRIGEWIAALAGIVLLVSLFLPWWSLPGDFRFESEDLNGGYFESWMGDPHASGSTTWSAWEALSTTDVLLALLAVAAIAIWLVTATAENTAPGIASQALLVPFALVMAVVCLIRVLNLPEPFEMVDEIADVEIGYGAWLGLAATFAVLAGILIAMRDERLSKPGQPTDQTGVPVDAPPAIEKLPAPPPA
jgi:hypothetical protein